MARIVVQASLAALPRNPTSDDPSRARDERRFPKNHLRDSDGQMEGRAHVDRRRHPVRMWLLLLALSACDDAAPADAPRDGGAGRDAGSAPGRDGGSRGPDAGAMDAGERAPAEVGECGAPDPAWVFCSDFEEGDLDAWDDFDGNPAPDHSIVEDPGPFALAGNHVGRLLPPSGRGGADFVKELPEPLDRAYARWYVQFEAGFDFDARNHGGGLFAGPREFLGQSDNRPDGSWFQAILDYQPGTGALYAYTYSRGMYQDCADPSGACWGDSYPCVYGGSYCDRPQHLPRAPLASVEAGRWYCVEMMMDGGTPTSSAEGADGTLDFWVDGAQQGPFDDLWLRTSADVRLSILWLNLFHHEDHADAGQRYDHVVVSRERIGCLEAR
jgi:hypothetical protein